ncbi:hypothetical protein F1880_001730 [Penicillium rolfsii]|nr:hypothetical protein F1880_001730 [Penicillium rolfsii]
MGDYQTQSDSMDSARKRCFGSRISNSHLVQSTRRPAAQAGFITFSASSFASARRPYKPV